MKNFYLKIFVSILVIQQLSASLFSQDTIYVRSIIDTLSSSYMSGRGYVNKGDEKAATYIKSQFEKWGLLKFQSDYFQSFSFPVNTFTGKMELIINDSVTIKPFYEMRIFAASSGLNGEFELVKIPYSYLTNVRKLKKINSKNNFSNAIIYFDFSQASEKKRKKKSFQNQQQLAVQNIYGAKGIVIFDNKLNAWGISSGKKTMATPVINVHIDKPELKPKKVKINIENKFYPRYKTQNVVGYVKGKAQPDSFIVFTAHYDHLGMMGSEIFFPGANDNASGVAAVLDLARYYSKPENQPYYSIAFMLFTGEEAGLLGSEYYTSNPLFPLKKIKCVLNLDMVGAGENGITAVNGTANEKEFSMFDSINTKNSLYPKLVKRGEAANSDHYYFHKNGIPALFFYTMGKTGPYHHPEDVSTNINLAKYPKLIELVTKFVEIYR